MSEFADTNILLYAYSSDPGAKQEQSIVLLQRLASDRTGVISTQVLVEFCSAAIRKLHMTEADAKAALSDFSDWPLQRPDFASVTTALHLQQRYQLAWHDAMILTSAIESGCSILWTEDFQDGQRFGDLVVRNPYKKARAV
ncbi:MAG TPA: PIN domain-containing protein [Bryobacteraceae bacterium]|nr:PIN domain-containing protein [Bryobacteraceae bacterium]